MDCKQIEIVDANSDCFVFILQCMIPLLAFDQNRNRFEGFVEKGLVNEMPYKNPERERDPRERVRRFIKRVPGLHMYKTQLHWPLQFNDVLNVPKCS